MNIAVLIHFLRFVNSLSTLKRLFALSAGQGIVQDDYEHRISLKCKLKCTFGHE